MKKSDTILLISIICIGLLVLASGKLTAISGDTVVITKDGDIFGEYPLDNNTTISIDDENIVKIENCEVYMENATCPDHLCIYQGKIKDSSKKIICLPNKLCIEVTKKSEIDEVVR